MGPIVSYRAAAGVLHPERAPTPGPEVVPRWSPRGGRSRRTGGNGAVRAARTRSVGLRPRAAADTPDPADRSARGLNDGEPGPSGDGLTPESPGAASHVPGRPEEGADGLRVELRAELRVGLRRVISRLR
jgi:hypothetical protein